MTTLGQLLYTRRQEQGWSLAALSREIGGSPTESFLWRIESGGTTPTPSVAIKLARALRLPEDVLLNAAGHTTSDQQVNAFTRLAEMVGTPPPVVVTYDVLDPETGLPTRERVQHVVKTKEEGFVIRLAAQADDLYNGECIVSTERQPVEGIGVVIWRNDRLSAATWHEDGTVTRGNETIASGFEVRGCIIRVIKARSWE